MRFLVFLLVCSLAPALAWEPARPLSFAPASHAGAGAPSLSRLARTAPPPPSRGSAAASQRRLPTSVPRMMASEPGGWRRRPFGGGGGAWPLTRGPTAGAAEGAAQLDPRRLWASGRKATAVLVALNLAVYLLQVSHVTRVTQKDLASVSNSQAAVCVVQVS